MAQVSKSQCIELQSNPGYYLERDAAYAWDRACAEFGKQVIITGAWRSMDTQVRLFDGEKFPNQTPQYGRYARGNRAGQRGYTTDVRGRQADGSLYRGSWWTRKAGTAAAAVPGTSNHGSGRAVDVKTRRENGDPGHETAVIFAGWNDEDRKRFLRIAAKHGWADDEGREVGEHWHQTYYPERDQHRGQKPKTTIQEDDMSEAAERQIDDLHRLLLRKFADGDSQIDIVTGVARTLGAVRATGEKINEVHAGTAPKIDKTAEIGGEKITLRTAIKETRLAVTGTLVTTVSRAVTTALSGMPGVDPKVVASATEKAVRDALSDGVTLIKES